MVEIRITFRGNEDRPIAEQLDAAGIDFSRVRKPNLTGFEMVTLVLSVGSIVVPTLTQILLELGKKSPNVTIHIDGRQQTIISAEQLNVLLQGQDDAGHETRL